MTKAEAMACSLNKSEKSGIHSSHPTLLPQQEPPLHRGGWKRTYLTRHKTAGDIVGERGSMATAHLKNLDSEIKELDALILKDEKSLKEMDHNLNVWKLEAERLQR